MHNHEKWSNILPKSCGMNDAAVLKYVEPFLIIIHARVKAAKGSSPILVVILTEFKQIN